MEKIEEFTDIFRKSAEYDELDRKFKLVCNKGIQETLQCITKFGLNNAEITELQAWKKIAEVTDTDEPTFNPADFYHDMRILFKNADLSEPVRGDKTLYDNGYRIVHKSSLPTQQDKVVVPPCVDKFLSVGNKSQKLACLVSCKYSILTCDMAEGELKQWLREISMDDLLSLANGYTVEKEQLYYVVFNKLGNNHHDCYLWIDEPNNGYVYFSDKPTMGKNKFTEQEIKAIDKRYWAFAVPVEEEAE